MGFEPTTLRDLVGCSNHWATGDSVASNTLGHPTKFTQLILFHLLSYIYDNTCQIIPKHFCIVK